MHLSLLTSCLFLRQTRNHSRTKQSEQRLAWAPGSDTDLGFAGSVGDQPDVLHGAVGLADLPEFLFGAGEGQARHEQLVFLQGSAVPEHLRRRERTHTLGPAQLPTPQGQASSTGRASAGSGCEELLTRPGQVPHFSMPSLPPLENGQNEGRHSPSLGEGRKVTHQMLGAAPSLLTIPRQGAVTCAYCYHQLSTPAAQRPSPAQRPQRTSSECTQLTQAFHS